MEKRNIQIDINTARKWYKIGGFYKDLALQAFNMNELETSNLPKSWDEYKSNHSYEDWYGHIVIYDKAHEAFDKLITLRDVYRQGWKPNWDKEDYKWVIINFRNELVIESYYYKGTIFSFPTQELEEQFLENFKEELEQFKEIL